MNSPEKLKLRAKKLSEILGSMGHKIGHGKCLEVLSRMEGFKDWNTYLASVQSPTKLLPIPTGWTTFGNQLDQYEFGVDAGSSIIGQHPAIIRAESGAKPDSDGFATLMQTCMAGDFAGKRVELRAHIKATDCSGAVTIWLRADSNVTGRHLAFDNMETRQSAGPLTGSTPWQERSIVLDIPSESVRLAYGFYLRGRGAGYGARFSIEEVDHDVALTSQQSGIFKAPFNLGFEQTGA